MEEVKKSTESKNFYLFIYNQIKLGKNPSKIAKELRISKQKLNYYIRFLKENGYIRKISYGVWETAKPLTKEVKKSTRVALNNSKKIFTSLKPDSVRGHAFQFKLLLPSELRNWHRKEEILQQLGIPFKKLAIKGAISITHNGKKIWLTNKSIIIYEKESFISETAKESKSLAIYHFLKIIKSLEKTLKADFSFGGTYKFKVTRQHYSLIKNALAKQYDKEGKKLNCYTADGLWLVIDNSYNLHETETLHPKTAVKDNEKIQNFFNGIKVIEGYTPQFVLSAITQNAQNLDNYAKYLTAHIDSVKKLGQSVEELTHIIKQLSNKINKNP